MPMKISSVADAGEVHPNPFVGPVNHTYVVKVDVSGLTSNEVDANGYIKPGVPLKIAGGLLVLADGTAGEYIAGAVVEAVQIHTDNTTLAGVTADVEIAIALFCLMNRDILEDSLGRALTANELAAIAAAGSHVAITPT